MPSIPGAADADALERAARIGMTRIIDVQDGVFLRAQARAADVTRSSIDDLIRRAKWIRVLPGVLADACADTTGAATRLRAATLWAGPKSVIGGRAALVWADVTIRMPDVIDIFVPVGQRRAAPRGIRTIRGAVPAEDWFAYRELRITTVERSCLDLARWGYRNDYLDLVLRTKSTTVERISASLGRSARRRGQRRARRAAQSVTTNPWSPVERTFHDALSAAGFTGWVANKRVSATGRAILPDIAFPHIKLAIEIDGRRYHDEAFDPDAFERDHRRQLLLQRDGWTVIRVTRQQIEHELPLILETIRMMISQLSAGVR